MAINFPSKPEIHLAKAPVHEVICQVRFPFIFRINKDDPSEFQEEIRKEFPKVEIEQGVLIPFPEAGTKEKLGDPQIKKTYRFRTMDEKTAVSLSTDFFALSTTQYTHWSDFSEILLKIANAVNDIYKPAYATRIGLRYINRITSQLTNKQSLNNILQLLNPELTTYFRHQCWSDPLEMETRILLSDDDGKMNLRTRFGEDNNNKPFFLLDFDYFEEGEIDLINLNVRVDAYHDVVYRAFRWCVRDEMLDVFQTGVS